MKKHISYKFKVYDTSSMTNMPSYMFVLSPILSLAPRALRGSRGVKTEDLKTYVIYVDKGDVDNIKI